MHFKIRKDDQIMIKVGREKGKTGKVARVIPDKGMVVIEKLNMVSRHQKPSQKNKQGGIVEKEAPMAISNVMILCEKCKGPVRVGTKKLDDGKSVRYCKKCSEVIDK
jgi:large subunit ribosomal protein L24